DERGRRGHRRLPLGPRDLTDDPRNLGRTRGVVSAERLVEVRGELFLLVRSPADEASGGPPPLRSRATTGITRSVAAWYSPLRSWEATPERPLSGPVSASTARAKASSRSRPCSTVASAS